MRPCASRTWPNAPFTFVVPEIRALTWRLIYAVLWGRVAQHCLTWMLRLYSMVRTPAAAEGVIGMIDRRFTFSGWPHYGRGWTNLHASRFTTRVRRGLRPAVRRPVRLPVQPLTRIVLVGGFSGLLGFPKELFERCPIELVIADIRFNGADASYLAGIADQYQCFDLDRRADEITRIAEFINGCGAQMALNIGQKAESHELIELINTACIANYCAGSELLHYDAIDIQYHGQPEADYFVRDGRMFCGTTRSFFSSQFIATFTGYIDPRGLLSGSPAPWRRRRPLIVNHGSLHKFASPEYLSIVCDWLAAEPSCEFVLFGRDDGGWLSEIKRRLDARGLLSRLRYEGHFSATRNAAGEVAGEGWDALVSRLGQARLAPNPFPLGGGSSRYEAYALGAPAPHLGVRFDREMWGRPQPSICEIPSMLVPRGTAATIDQYRELGFKCLRDEAFADALSAEQMKVARSVIDADRWWREIIDGHRQWMARVTVAA